MAEGGQALFQIGADFLGGVGFLRHMLGQEINQFGQRFVEKFTVMVTPFTIVLLKGTVWLAADRCIVQRHPTTLANQVPGGTQQSVNRHVQLRQTIGDALHRGKVDVLVLVEDVTGSSPVSINIEVVRAYKQQIMAMASDLDIA